MESNRISFISKFFEMSYIKLPGSGVMQKLLVQMQQLVMALIIAC